MRSKFWFEKHALGDSLYDAKIFKKFTLLILDIKERTNAKIANQYF